MERTTARLRKTFQYPTDDDGDDDIPEALDEEEQESLIQSLVLENTTRNARYAKALLFLPLLCIFPYLGSLFKHQTAFLSILSITSLLSTAYLTYTLPHGHTGMALLDALNMSPDQNREGDANPGPLPIYLDHGPVRTYLPYLNVALSAVLALLGLVFRGREMVWWGFSWLPGSVYTIVMMSKFLMGSVNPEVELDGLRYELRGA